MKKVLGCIRKCDKDFGLIDEGDHVMVGVSGGKDSLLLLRAMRLYQYFSPNKFRLTAATLTMGLEPFDLAPVRALCDEIGVEYIIKETQIGKIVFEERNEKNPCSLCANLRRGALNNLAVERGANKVALAHHREDALETFLLSMLYEGRLHTFAPKTYLSRCGVTVIRPMLYVPESHVIHMKNELNLPVVKNPCPADGETKRQEMKDFLKQMLKIWPDATDKMLAALKNHEQYGLWERTPRR